jgi:hypothetical protein
MSARKQVEKRRAVRLVAVLAAGVLSGAALGEGQASGEAGATLATDRDRLSYAMGMDLGAQLRRSGVDIDPGIFGRALGDALSGGKTLLTPDEARQEIGRLQADMIRRQAQARGQGQPGQAPGAGQGQAVPAQGQVQGQGQPVQGQVQGQAQGPAQGQMQGQVPAQPPTPTPRPPRKTHPAASQ